MDLIVRWLGGAFGPYIVGALAALLLSLATATGVQTARLSAAKGELTQLKTQIELAAQQSATRGAVTGVEALETYAAQNQQDAPVVERVVTRVRNVCLREPEGHLPVPAGTGDAEGAAGGTEDDGDRAFAAAIAGDLATCQSELNRFAALQRWCIANGC